MCLKKAGRDVIHRENKTHIELNTRHVVAKTSGMRLFDVHLEGAGSGDESGVPMEGATGIGIVGEIAIVLVVIAVGIWLWKRYLAGRVRHDSYKEFWRAATISNPFAPRVPPRAPQGSRPSETYPGPNVRALERALDRQERLQERERERERDRRGDVSGTYSSVEELNEKPKKKPFLGKKWSKNLAEVYKP